MKKKKIVFNLGYVRRFIEPPGHTKPEINTVRDSKVVFMFLSPEITF